MFKTHDGIEIKFDLYQVKRSEYVKIARGIMEDENLYEVMARVTGQPTEFFENLNVVDWNKLFREFHNSIAAAVEDNEDSKN
jgi:hypothetical protein